MEWAELLVGLIGGGVGGTILGRIWDNNREDRFRHVEIKREVATRYASHVYSLGSTLERFDSSRRRKEEVSENRENSERFEKWLERGRQQRKEAIGLNGEVYMLFGEPVMQAISELDAMSTGTFLGGQYFDLVKWSDKATSVLNLMKRELYV